MIISPKYKLAFLPVERTGSQSIELMLKAKDPDLYRLGHHRHGKAEVPEGYQFMTTKRNPLDRLASYFTKITINDFSYPKHFETFEEFMNFIVTNKDKPFLDNPEAPLFAPHCKMIGDELVQVPIPVSYYMADMPEPDVVVNYENYINDVKALPFFEEGDEVLHFDGNDWDIDELRFSGMEVMANQYDGGN